MNHCLDTVRCHYPVAYRCKCETTNLGVMAVNVSICQVEKHQSLIILEKKKMQIMVKTVKSHLKQPVNVPKCHHPPVTNESHVD